MSAMRWACHLKGARHFFQNKKCQALLIAVSLLSASPLLHFAAEVAFAEVAYYIGYQGRLTEADGTSVTGQITMTFRLYDASTGGTEKWKEDHTFTISSDDSGTFNVVLGSATALSSVDFNSPLWLSVQVSGDTEMTPRQRLTAAGVSLNTDKLDGLDSTSFLRTDVDTATSGKLTITRSGTAILIKPTTNPAADTKLIDIQNASASTLFSVDIEGDATLAGSLAVTGTISGSTSVTGTTSATWTIDNDNTSGTEPASGAGLVIEGGSGDASLLWDATNDELDLNKAINITGNAILSAQGDVRFADSDSSNYVALQAPATVSSNVTWTLPSADGSSSQVLSTSGSGTLSWATVDTSTSNEAPVDATYITQTANSTLTNEQVLADLSTGILKVTTSTGVISSLGDPLPVANGGTGATSLSDLITLATHTTGNYVATVSGSSPISVSGSGSENAAVSLSCSTCLTSTGGGTFSISLAGTSGTTQTINAGDTITIAAGSGMTTTAGATDTVTVDLGGTLSANTTIDTGGFDLIVDDTSSSDLFIIQNAQTTPDRMDMYVANATSGGVTLGDFVMAVSDSVAGILIDTQGATQLSSVTTTDAREALAITTDPSQGSGDAGADADGVIKLGIQEGAWEYIHYDASLGSAGKFVFSAPLKVAGSSPASIEFDDGTTTKTLTFDSTQVNPFQFNANVQATALEVAGASPAMLTFGNATAKTDIIFDPDTDKIWFSRGIFAQQFRNLLENSSFEAFSALETFSGSTATGSSGGSGNTFWGGWSNFAPDEWIWEGGKVYQNAPALFTPGTSVTATTLQQDYYHGKSAVTLEDDNTSATNGPYNATTDAATNPYSGTITDAHIEQTITGLKPSTVYAVGIYMRRAGSAANAIVDVTGERTTPSTTLAAALAPTATKMSIQSADFANFPTDGIVIIGSERISYTGKDSSTNQLTSLLRGFESTTTPSTSYAINTPVTFAPFKHLESGIGAVSNFTLYKGQLVTTSTADDIKLHIICVGTSATPSDNRCRFDAGQLVEGRSVPEFQPSAIVDTGDQTVYGSLRMGRTSDGRGGVLAVDKTVRTRSIEFFEKDPGMSGTTGGFGGVGTATKIGSGANSTITMTVSGTYFGANPRDMLVAITATSPQTFKWEYRECSPMMGCTGTYVTGGTGLLVSSFTSAATELSGSMGVRIQFANTTTVTTSDQWSFYVSGMNLGMQYNSYSGTSTYQPGDTRIYLDPFSERLTFKDGTTIVTLQQLAGSGTATPAYVTYPSFFPASSGGGNMWLDTRDGNLFSNSNNMTLNFDVEIVGAATPDTFRWRDNVMNGSNTAAADWDEAAVSINTTTGEYTFPVPGGGGDLNYNFKIKFGSPAGTYADGNAVDRWTFTAYPAQGSTTLTGITGGTGISVSGSGSSRDVQFAPTEMSSFTWGSGSSATFTHTFNVQTGTDPVITFGNNSIDVSTGVLRVGGADVLTTSSGAGGDITAVGSCATGACFVDEVASAATPQLVVEGTTVDANEFFLNFPANVASDVTVTLPATTGTLITTGDTGTVTSTMISDSTITTDDIAADTIAAGDIATGAVTTTEILDSTITTDDIAADTIAAADIATGGVGAAEVADDTLTATDLNVNVVSSLSDGSTTVTNDGGNITIAAGTGATVVANNTTKTITISAAGSGGDITDVLAGGGISVANSGGPQPTVSLGGTLTANTTIGLGGYDLIIDDTKLTDVFQLQNAQPTADTATFYVADTATASQANLVITPSDGGVVIDTLDDGGVSSTELTSVTDTDAREALAIAIDPAGAGDVDGLIKLGKQNGNWEYIHYDASLSTGGQFVFSAPLKVLGPSGAALLTFEDNSDPNNPVAKYLKYDKTAGTDMAGAFVFEDQAIIPSSSPAYLAFGANANNTLMYAFKLNPDVSPKTLSIVEVNTSGQSPVETTLFQFAADGSFGIQDASGAIQKMIQTGGKLSIQTQNLIRGGSFEGTQPTGWESVNSGVVGLDTVERKFGNKSLKLQDNSAANAMGGRFYLPYSTEFVGQRVTLSFWAKTGTGTAIGSVGFSGTSAETTPTNGEVTDFCVDTTWRQFKVSYPAVATSTISTSANQISVWMLAADGTAANSCSAGGTVTGGNLSTSTTTGGNGFIYVDGITLVPGPIAMDFGPAPIMDSGSQVIYGNLAIGAHADTYATGGMAQLVFGEPDSSFGSGYGGYGMGTGSIRFEQWGADGGRFRLNRGIWIDDALGTGGGYGASLNIGSFSGGQYSQQKGDIFARGRLELRGHPQSGSYPSPQTTLVVGHDGSGGSIPSNQINNATSQGDVYIKGNLEVDGTIFGNISGAGGDITAVGSCATGACFVDEVASAATPQLVVEGTTVDGNEFFLNFPANVASDVTVTLPATTGTVITTGDTGTVTSTMIADNQIANADIASNAAIAFSKLAALTSGNILVGNASNVVSSVAMSGDATLSNTGVLSLASNAVGASELASSAIQEGDFGLDLASDVTLTVPATKHMLRHNGTAWVNVVEHAGTDVTADLEEEANIGATAITGNAVAATAGQVIRSTGNNAAAWGALDLADTDAVTGILVDANVANDLTISTSNNLSVNADKKINLEGSAGDTYLLFDSANNRIRLFVNAVEVARLKN